MTSVLRFSQPTILMRWLAAGTPTLPKHEYMHIYSPSQAVSGFDLIVHLTEVHMYTVMSLHVVQRYHTVCSDSDPQTAVCYAKPANRKVGV